MYIAHKWLKYSFEGVIVMKKLSVVLVVVLSLCLVVSLAFAGDMKGTVKSVDAKAGSVVLTVDGKDTTYTADKAVDLGKVKAGDKVEFSADKNVVKSIKAAAAPAKKAPVGC
jgi:Cu/Ag efflux protein CusF